MSEWVDLEISAAATAGVAVIALAIALGAWRALLRTGNRRIWFVVAGFSVFALKSLVKAATLARGRPEGSTMEFLFSLLDLGTVALIAWPLLGARRDPSP